MEIRKIVSAFRLSEKEKSIIAGNSINAENVLCVCDGFSAYLKSNGDVVVNDSTEIMEQISDWPRMIRLCSGKKHILALAPDGTVYSAGSNDEGQCNTADWKNIREIFCGKYYSAALTADEELVVTGKIYGNDADDETISKKFIGYLNKYNLIHDERFSGLVGSVNGLAARLNAIEANVKGEISSKEAERQKLKNELRNELRTELLNELRNEMKNISPSPDYMNKVKPPQKVQPQSTHAGEKRVHSAQSGTGFTGTINAQKKFCYKCMKSFNGGKYCPRCGFNTESTPFPNAVKPGTDLMDNLYHIGAELTRNNAGIRYAGFSEKLNQKVMIHEFLPSSYCSRIPGSSMVSVNKLSERRFNELKEKFIKYYQTLYSIPENEAAVKILDIFSEGNIPYIIERFDGESTLKEYVQRNGPVKNWEELKKNIRPIAEYLLELHETYKIGHFGVSPENIRLTANKRYCLTGFEMEDVRHAGGLVEPELVNDCSAIEQYNRRIKLDQATDVYGFTATLYYLMTGINVGNANKRLEKSSIPIPSDVFNRVPPYAVELIKGGLWVSKSDRIQTFRQVLSLLH